MAVFKIERSPYWQIEFTLHGEHVRRSSGTTSKTEARTIEERWRREIHDRHVNGKQPEKDRITLGAAIDRYYQKHLVKVKGNETHSQQKARAKDWYCLNAIRSHFGADRPLDTITGADITTYRDSLLDRLKPASVNRQVGYLKAILNKAIEWGVAVTLEEVATLDPGPQPDRFLTYAEEKKLLAELAPHIRDVAVFSLDSGCRKEECLTLKWPTVVFENDGSVSIIIRAAYSKNRKPVKKPLPNRAAELLRRLRKEHPESSGHVFLGVDGEPIKSIGTGFNAAVRRAGLGDDVTFHTLRHTYASRLAQAGVPLLDISKALNHSSVRMAERYAHLAPSNLKAAVAVLNRVPEPEATVS